MGFFLLFFLTFSPSSSCLPALPAPEPLCHGEGEGEDGFLWSDHITEGHCVIWLLSALNSDVVVLWCSSAVVS